MIDTTSDQAKKIITKDLNNWNSNFWRLRCREQVIKLEISKLLLRSSNFLQTCSNFCSEFIFHKSKIRNG